MSSEIIRQRKESISYVRERSITLRISNNFPKRKKNIEFKQKKKHILTKII